MYNALGVAKGLSLTKIIGGISKTLQIANQIIPLYQKTKPLISNARSAFHILKEVSTSKNKDLPQKASLKQNKNQTIENIKKESTNSPTFFL